MTAPTAFVADDVRATMVAYRDALRHHQQAINRLNVYPVPDGDTGTNMALTLEAVVKELDGLGERATMADVCRAVSHGSLMGARGNSGVILSQLLRGIAGQLARAEEVGPADLAEGLRLASDLAQAAVVRPVEGTILTVARAAGDGAMAGQAAGGQLVDVVERARATAADALARTPEILDVLARAGVVDAGGTGYLLLLDAVLTVLDGRALPEPPAADDLATAAAAASADGGLAAHAPTGAGETVTDLRYEVMYLLDAPDDTIPAFKDVWAGIGDSIVVVGGDGLWNCHIHTDDIGAAVEAALDAGRPREIRVTDLAEQVEEERWVREGAAGVIDEPAGPPPTTAVVAVVTGEGVGRIFRSLGVHHLVARRPVDEPVDRPVARGRRGRRVRPGRRPPEQQEHPARRRAGRRAHRQGGPRRGDRQHRRGVRRPPRLRPRRRRRRERRGDGRVGLPRRRPPRSPRPSATARPTPGPSGPATGSACRATASSPSPARRPARRWRCSSGCSAPTTSC